MTNGHISHPTTRAERLQAVLTRHFSPISLTVEDDSASHAGHSGARAGAETHYTVSIVSKSFSGLNRVARSRLVYTVLTEEFAEGLHALSLILRSPEEN